MRFLILFLALSFAHSEPDPLMDLTRRIPECRELLHNWRAEDAAARQKYSGSKTDPGYVADHAALAAKYTSRLKAVVAQMEKDRDKLCGDDQENACGDAQREQIAADTLAGKNLDYDTFPRFVFGMESLLKYKSK
jgi:hypothetical protein